VFTHRAAACSAFNLETESSADECCESRSKTPQMNTVMCFLTAATIIVLMLFVADMDDVTQ
jgi:hypothetical protein